MWVSDCVCNCMCVCVYDCQNNMRRMKTKQRFADKTDFDIGSEIDTRRW